LAIDSPSFEAPSSLIWLLLALRDVEVWEIAKKVAGVYWVGR
jgi:hypothetical protein